MSPLVTFSAVTKPTLAWDQLPKPITRSYILARC